jgi:TRAP-type C4-dicarboxylate transport system substrate-binding protein
MRRRLIGVTMTLTRAAAALLTSCVVLAAATACSGDPSTATNKTGAEATTSTTIQLAIPDIGDLDGAYFADAVERESEGRIKVQIDDSFDSADTAKEARLAPALADGSVDAAYMPARDWALPGLPGFQALAAPFSVTTQEAMQSVATSHFAASALESLEDKGVVGLALIPVEPRQLLSSKPLVTAGDFEATSIRVVLNQAVGDAVSTLGGTPVDVPDSASVQDRLASGELTAAETSPLYALSNSYVRSAPFLTSFGLYGKFQVIGVSEGIWGDLDDDQRAALRAAAVDTVKHAQDMPEREAKALGAVCAQDAVVTQTSADEIAHIASIARVDTSQYADAAQQLAAIPGTGPQPAAIDVPSTCTVATDTPSAIAALEQLQGEEGGDLPQSETTTIPDGTYVTTDTVADWHDGGQYGADWDTDITFTWVLQDGTFHTTQDPDFPDQGPCGGTYETEGDLLTIHYTEGGCTELQDEVTRWSYFDGLLSFTIVEVEDTAGRVIYSAHPWRKTG